jgi:hypothetical protein
VSRWQPWLADLGEPSPYDHRRVLIAYQPIGWGVIWHELVAEAIVEPLKMPPAWNVAGVWWRPVR